MNSYNQISGKKTLILVVGIMILIITLSIYLVYTLVVKSSIRTQSTSFEKIAQPTISSE